MLVMILFLFTIVRAFGAKPFALRFCGKANASEVEPLNGALKKEKLYNLKEFKINNNLELTSGLSQPIISP